MSTNKLHASGRAGPSEASQHASSVVNPEIRMYPNAALVVIDVQQTFDDADYWGNRDNPDAEKNIHRLVDYWQNHGLPLVMVTHTSTRPESTFHPDRAGSRLKSFLADVQSTVSVTKTVNSSFLGSPNLQDWLTANGIKQVVLCGIQTNMCVETTARMSGNLGFKTVVAIDACHTFDLQGPDGSVTRAADLSKTTATNLFGGGFAEVVTVQSIIMSSQES